jgi:hypothetical protein
MAASEPRPAVVEARHLACEMPPRAIETLYDISTDRTASIADQLTAATMILDVAQRKSDAAADRATISLFWSSSCLSSALKRSGTPCWTTSSNVSINLSAIAFWMLAPNSTTYSPVFCCFPHVFLHAISMRRTSPATNCSSAFISARRYSRKRRSPWRPTALICRARHLITRSRTFKTECVLPGRYLAHSRSSRCQSRPTNQRSPSNVFALALRAGRARICATTCRCRRNRRSGPARATVRLFPKHRTLSFLRLSALGREGRIGFKSPRFRSSSACSVDIHF